MKRMNFEIEERLFKKFKHNAIMEGLTMKELGTELITNYLEKGDKKMKYEHKGIKFQSTDGGIIPEESLVKILKSLDDAQTFQLQINDKFASFGKVISNILELESFTDSGFSISYENGIIDITQPDSDGELDIHEDLYETSVNDLYPQFLEINEYLKMKKTELDRELEPITFK